MGEYEIPYLKNKKKPNQPRNPLGLYPLAEEGTYGPPPVYTPPIAGYSRRLARPKVYPAYTGSR